jgi:mannose-6-phosphate isomerase-like protein (cupin superfamily)
MRTLLLGAAAGACVFAVLAAQGKINPTDPQPTCRMCPGTVIPAAELEAYTQKAIAEHLIDQQVRDIDIGKAHVGIGMVYRGKLDRPGRNSVAEHDQVSEVYHVISGSATLVLGPDILNRQRRPATQRTVVEFNGPGNNGSDIRNGVEYHITTGDVVVIPAGTGHWFTKIDDHINYLMVRFDPDKVTPIRGEQQSRGYLSRPAQR